jgi:hypothetical protein
MFFSCPSALWLTPIFSLYFFVLDIPMEYVSSHYLLLLFLLPFSCTYIFICVLGCAFGEGRFDIYAKLSSGDLKLAGSNGNFGAGKTSNFSISAKADVHTLKPTSRPTAQPTTLPPGLRPTHQPAKSPTVFSSTLRPSTASFHPATPTSQTPGPEAVKCKDSTRLQLAVKQIGALWILVPISGGVRHMSITLRRVQV